MVKKELLDELKQILKEDYDLNLNDEDVYIVGNTLVKAFEILIEADTFLPVSPHKKP
jgi:hypothetical protein